MDWLDLLAVQGTLKSSPTPQFKSTNSSVLSFLYSPALTTIHDYWKNHSLTRWTFVGKVMSLLFNMLSRLVISFLPRSKRLLISWLQSPSAVILEPRKIVSHYFSIYLPWSDGTGFHDLSFLHVELQANFSLSSFIFIVLCFLPCGVICISGVIDISPDNLDSSLCFFQPRVSHDVLCI